MGELQTGSMRITVEQPDVRRIKSLDIISWPIWTKEPSTFDWHYDDRETCFFLAGEVVVRTAEGEVRMGKGDLVTFPKGLSCTWHIKQAVRKHYRFG